MTDHEEPKGLNTPAATLRRRPDDWPKRSSAYAHPRPSVRDVVASLEAGRLDLLAEHIRDRDCKIDEQVALTLYDLICGPKTSISFRLTMKGHPDKAKHEATAQEVGERERRTALAMLRYAQLHKGRDGKLAKHKAAEAYAIAPSRLEDALTRANVDPEFAQRMFLIAAMLN